jgi:uncharacterized RDD family membrane protein YckC
VTPGDPNAYRVDTPEQIDVAYDLAGLGSRFLASLVDSLVQTVLLLLVFGLGTLGLRWLLGLTLSEAAAGRFALPIAMVVTFALWWGYHVFFEMVWHGQTPGKRAVGLRVIKEGGYPIGLGESLVRNLVRVLDALPGVYAVGGLVMFVDRRSRRLGDLVAGTVVVKERRELGLATLRSVASGDVEPGDPIPNLGRLTASDHALLRDYLGRRSQLAGPAAEAAGRGRRTLIDRRAPWPAPARS